MARFLEHHQSIGSFDDPELNPYALDDNGIGQGSLVGKGKGIVFTAGNADTLGRVVTTLKLLRQRYRCKLPAAIYHFPSENPGEDDSSESFLFIPSPVPFCLVLLYPTAFLRSCVSTERSYGTVRHELASLNAKLVSVTGEQKDETREKNWHLKAISIVQSEWAEVIYLVCLLNLAFILTFFLLPTLRTFPRHHHTHTHTSSHNGNMHTNLQ